MKGEVMVWGVRRWVNVVIRWIMGGGMRDVLFFFKGSLCCIDLVCGGGMLEGECWSMGEYG